MTADVHSGRLYDGHGQPVGDTPPFWGPLLLDPNKPRTCWPMPRLAGARHCSAPIAAAP